MVTAGTQKRQRLLAAKEAAAAEATIASELAKAQRRVARKDGWPCTAEQIVAERDGKALSWAQVAANLNLGSPGQARKAYTQLTGRAHNTSQPVVKRTSAPGGIRRAIQEAVWNDDSDQDEIIERVQGIWQPSFGNIGTKEYVPGHWSGSTLLVVRDLKGVHMEEEVSVGRIIKFAYDGKDDDGPLVMHVIDKFSGATRVFRVADIKEVR